MESTLSEIPSCYFRLLSVHRVALPSASHVEFLRLAHSRTDLYTTWLNGDLHTLEASPRAEPPLCGHTYSVVVVMEEVE
jgi:hypothetical protein